MPSYPRYKIIYDGSSFHLTWKCNNNSWFLKDEWAKKFYYDLLVKWKDFYGVSIHSYNLMDNHPHLVGKTIRKEGISHLMRRVNCLFAKKFNKKNNRRGQVIMDRFKSPSIQSDEHMLTVMIYVDLNPCRAKKVKHPKEYKWTSFHYYAYGKKDPLVTPAPSYLALADNDKDRRKIYIEMVEALLNDGLKKENYSSVHFIGDPSWVKNNYDSLKDWFKEKYLSWRDGPSFDYTSTDDPNTS